MWDLEGKKIRTDARGYIEVFFPEHPNAPKKGWVRLHRLVKENELGRLLLQEEIVHHDNRDRADNKPSNLILTDSPGHGRIHAADRPCLGETQLQLNCAHCGDPFTRPLRNVHYLRSFCSLSCSAKHQVRKGKASVGPHGYARYRTGCRCKICKQGNSDRMRDYMRSYRLIHR